MNKKEFFDQVKIDRTTRRIDPRAYPSFRHFQIALLLTRMVRPTRYGKQFYMAKKDFEFFRENDYYWLQFKKNDIVEIVFPGEEENGRIRKRL